MAAGSRQGAGPRRSRRVTSASPRSMSGCGRPAAPSSSPPRRRERGRSPACRLDRLERLEGVSPQGTVFGFGSGAGSTGGAAGGPVGGVVVGGGSTGDGETTGGGDGLESVGTGVVVAVVGSV